MKRLDFNGKLVVVTGASSGLGREIARTLAYREKANVVVAARRRERLEELKAEIESRCASRVFVVPVDLGAPAGPDTLFREATAFGEVDALVNCAGVTFYGKTLDASLEQDERIVAVNLAAGMKATMLFLRRFLERGTGAILTITSVSAFVPTPYQNVYSATKHGIQAFMEGLAREYRAQGVTFATFAPGGMATEMFTLSGLDRKFGKDTPFNMDAERAARKALEAFKKGSLCSVQGLLYKVAVFLARRAPRRLVAWAVERIYAP